MRLSNGHHLGYYAVFPHCLDDQYLPIDDMRQHIGSNDPMPQDILDRRQASVYRELIRSLIYSPQVYMGRQSPVNDPTVQAAFSNNEETTAKLMSNGKIAFLTMESSFQEFLDTAPFRLDPAGKKFWKDFIQKNGEAAVCKLRLTPEQEKEVKRRYRNFFTSLHEDDGDLGVLFAAATGREISDLANPDVNAEFADFRELVHEDIVPWAASLDFKVFGRAGVKGEFVNLATADDSDRSVRRKRHSLTVWLLANLAYNCNMPATLKRHSFVPPGSLDPGALPRHIFPAPGLLDLDEHARLAAGQEAFTAIVESRADARQHFFYRMQQKMDLPDIGSFTLKDVAEIHEWPEWKTFMACEDAVMRFTNINDLHDRLNEFYDAVIALHRKMESELRSRSWWRKAVHGGMALAVGVVAHYGCQNLLPEHVHHLPTLVHAAAMGVGAVTLEAGIDIVIHGLSNQTKKICHYIGGRQTMSRQLQLTAQDQAMIEMLRTSDAVSRVLDEDRALGQTENMAMEK